MVSLAFILLRSEVLSPVLKFETDCHFKLSQTRLHAANKLPSDMDGDGKDDYIWIGPNGLIDIYLNTNNAPYWENHGSVITLGVPRKNIRIADMDGDGKCDVSVARLLDLCIANSEQFISVDPADGQRAHMWHNQWDASARTWNFVNLGLVSGAECLENPGVIENDYGVQYV